MQWLKGLPTSSPDYHPPSKTIITLRTQTSFPLRRMKSFEQVTHLKSFSSLPLTGLPSSQTCLTAPCILWPLEPLLTTLLSLYSELCLPGLSPGTCLFLHLLLLISQLSQHFQHSWTTLSAFLIREQLLTEKQAISNYYTLINRTKSKPCYLNQFYHFTS